MSTVSICGWFIVFVLKSGIVEFFGTLLEPLMRPLFKMPGAAAVNCLSSYVVSAAVGVYMTDQYYESKVYTQRGSYCCRCLLLHHLGWLHRRTVLHRRYREYVRAPCCCSPSSWYL